MPGNAFVAVNIAMDFLQLISSAQEAFYGRANTDYDWLDTPLPHL